MNKKRTALFLFDSGDGSVKRISPETMNLAGFEILDDKVFYFGMPREGKPSFEAVMYLYDRVSGENKTVRDDRVYSVSGSAQLGGRDGFFRPALGGRNGSFRPGSREFCPGQ